LKQANEMIRYPKIRELKEAITSLLTPAETTHYPYKEHIPFENFRGKPVVDDMQCVGCETCANVCPSGAITIDNDTVRKKRVITRDYGKCIFCGQCEANCITQGGIKLSNKLFDLATFDKSQLVEKQEKELLICENCGSIITTKEHINYLYYKLGARAYASLLSLNMLNSRLQLTPPEDISVEIADGLKRKDMFNIICPNCLRKVLLKNLI
jgi:formate hydrogenlyase subunit 6/NADH:ubiquinone oxidoreductase subunit I